MSTKIRKVVIPVAGWGTRLLPATKAQPKEMMPILDKPTIQYIVEEAVRAGITDIILVTGQNKRAIEDHFDRNEYLEQYLRESGKHDAQDQIRKIAQLANFVYIRQKGPYGTGTPILNARGVIGDEPFAVVFGDEIWSCPDRPHLGQLIDVYEKYGDPVITAYPTDDEGASKYAIVDGVEVESGVYQVKSLLEKPGPTTASRMASLGGYILTPDIFGELEQLPVTSGREFYLTDAIAALMRHRPVYAKLVEGVYRDTGSKLAWLKTNIDMALQDPEIGADVRAWLREKM